MRIRMLLVASSLLLASACGGPAPMEGEEAAPTPAATQPSEEATDHSAQWLSCWTYDGTACTTPGRHFTCYNQYPYEPGICFCGNDYLYSCG